jgi:hypothetical protein
LLDEWVLVFILVLYFSQLFILRLEITCDYKANGCQKSIKWESLQKHKKECDFNPTTTITCPHGCELMMQISKLKVISNF